MMWIRKAVVFEASRYTAALFQVRQAGPGPFIQEVQFMECLAVESRRN